MKGKLIVIEGLDGSGKSTQIECLKNKLNGKNVHQIGRASCRERV